MINDTYWERISRERERESKETADRSSVRVAVFGVVVLLFFFGGRWSQIGERVCIIPYHTIPYHTGYCMVLYLQNPTPTQSSKISQYLYEILILRIKISNWCVATVIQSDHGDFANGWVWSGFEIRLQRGFSLKAENYLCTAQKHAMCLLKATNCLIALLSACSKCQIQMNQK